MQKVEINMYKVEDIKKQEYFCCLRVQIEKKLGIPR